MSKLTWSKWFWDAHSKSWRGHPLWMEGAWMRVLEQLHSSKETGVMSRPINSWAMIIGCTEKEADEFIKHIDKYDLASVEFGDDITISSRRMIRNEEERNGTADRVRKHRAKKVEIKTEVKEKKATNSKSSERRSDMLKKLREAYPQNRAHLQPSTQREEFKKIMIECSKNIAPNNKEVEEMALFKKIQTRIMTMSDTSEWTKEDGKFVPGLGNFLKSRAWETSHVIKADVKKIKEHETNNLWG